MGRDSNSLSRLAANVAAGPDRAPFAAGTFGEGADCLARKRPKELVNALQGEGSTGRIASALFIDKTKPYKKSFSGLGLARGK